MFVDTGPKLPQDRRKSVEPGSALLEDKDVSLDMQSRGQQQPGLSYLLSYLLSFIYVQGDISIRCLSLSTHGRAQCLAFAIRSALEYRGFSPTPVMGISVVFFC